LAKFCQSEKQLFQLQWAHKHSLTPVNKGMDIGIGQHLWLLLVSVCLKALSHNLELAGLSQSIRQVSVENMEGYSF
jgi:hypothetical protein